MAKKLAYVFASAILLASTPISAEAAATRGIKKKDLVNITVTYTYNNQQLQKQVTCYHGAGGKASKSGKTYTFTSFAQMIKTLKKRHAHKKAIQLEQALKTASDTACKSQTPPPGGFPDFLSLKAYTGPFGEDQARTLFDRFAFSASPERIQLAVADGLAKTITKLTTFTPEPNLDAIETNMRCNGLLPGDPRNGTTNYTCDTTDVNDIDMGGLKAAIVYKMWYSQNGFFHNLFFFLHNRFQSVNTRVLGGCTTWAVGPYVDLVRRASQSGDYIQYLKDFGTDYFGAIIWLHLLDSTKDKPNEDEGREILQLGGTGAQNLDGTPVYGDLDIAQNALALSGWIDTYDSNANHGHGLCVPAYSWALHAPGPETIFIGTPYQAQVSDLNSVVAAIANHPRLAERIAENIYDEYINPYATPAAIRELAGQIRANNYNLITTLRTVMASQALYATKSQKSIPKQPLEYVLGFLRITGIPLTGDYYQLTNILSDIGQVPLEPGTVFGWTNRNGLAGESYVLNRRNAIISLLNQNATDLSSKGYTYWDRFLTGLPADSTASQQFIARLENWFHVTLNANQIAALDQFLNYDQNTCNQYTHCAAGQATYLVRDQFDAAVDSQNEGRTSNSYKTRGAVAMMAMMPDFMMK
jgi:hypothetical protein